MTLQKAELLGVAKTKPKKSFRGSASLKILKGEIYESKTISKTYVR